MQIETFIARIESGKSCSHLYKRDGKESMINVWKHLQSYILTWEECLPGKQYDESEYTRDERKEFASVELLIDFLKEQGIDPESFVP